QSSEVPSETVREVQVQLAARGFSPGPATGQLTEQTVDALRQLQRSRAIDATGQINTNTLTALGLGRATESSGTPPASMSGPGTTAAGSTPQGATPVGTPLPGGTATGVPLGGATPPGAPSPSFGATPAGAPSPAFGATPPGMQSPTSTIAGAPA